VALPRVKRAVPREFFLGVPQATNCNTGHHCNSPIRWKAKLSLTRPTGYWPLPPSLAFLFFCLRRWLFLQANPFLMLMFHPTTFPSWTYMPPPILGLRILDFICFIFEWKLSAGHHLGCITEWPLPSGLSVLLCLLGTD